VRERHSGTNRQIVLLVEHARKDCNGNFSDEDGCPPLTSFRRSLLPLLIRLDSVVPSRGSEASFLWHYVRPANAKLLHPVC
jgi:hypothetical protein